MGIYNTLKVLAKLSSYIREITEVKQTSYKYAPKPYILNVTSFRMCYNYKLVLTYRTECFLVLRLRPSANCKMEVTK